MIGRTVGVTQIVRLEDLHRSMVVARRRLGGERAALAVELRPVALRLVPPCAFGGRREADLVDAVAVIEAGHGDMRPGLPGAPSPWLNVAEHCTSR